MVSTRGLRYKFSEGERVLCYEPDPTKAKVLYDSKVLEVVERKDKRGRRSIEYLIHFQGWNSSWDRCVSEDYVLKDTEENRQLQRDLADKAQLQIGAYLYRRERKKPNNASSNNTTNTPVASKRLRRSLDTESSTNNTQNIPEDVESLDTDSTSSGSGWNENMSQHINRVEIRIPPELRLRLKIDSQLINLNGRLLRLPASPCVADILEGFVHWFGCVGVLIDQRGRTEYPEFACRINLVREVADGLRIYFDFILKSHLLYKQEIEQYHYFCGQYEEDEDYDIESDEEKEEVVEGDEEEYSQSECESEGDEEEEMEIIEEEQEDEEVEEEEDEDDETLIHLSQGSEQYEEDNEQNSEIDYVNNKMEENDTNETINMVKIKVEKEDDYEEEYDAEDENNIENYHDTEFGVKAKLENNVDNLVNIKVEYDSEKEHNVDNGNSIVVKYECEDVNNTEEMDGNIDVNNIKKEDPDSELSPSSEDTTSQRLSSENSTSGSDNKDENMNPVDSSDQKPNNVTSSKVTIKNEGVRYGPSAAAPVAPTPRCPRSLLLEKVSQWKVIPRDDSTKHLPCRIYGATHLARLFIKLPQFLSATQMPAIKLKTILRYIDIFIQYLDKHSEWFGDV